ncbi:MAG: serine hydrolase domain-containing protein [Albimonas sp.]|uniref:serine hydrolase domain-containing protein n=1 Tax=Albimonas sp. TaxID=1872425 RepID=UPI0040568A6B
MTDAAPALRIEGHCAPGFEPVREAFARNFVEGGEVGASVCVTHRGETVVDLWGGLADPATGRAWERDTICVVFSCTKAATALTAHRLVEQGVLDLDAPAADLWPEFAAAGKGGATLRMMLDHTVGLPALREPLKPDCLLDPGYMVERLAAEAPFWTPSERTGYHALTYGFLIGEMIRRATGRSLGQVFAREIAGPLGLDFHIGLPASEEPRVAPMILFRPPKDAPETAFSREAKTPGTIPNLFLFNHGTWASGGVNTPEGRAAEIGAASGVANARALAGMFAPLASEVGPRLLRPETAAGFAQASSATHLDATLKIPTRFGPGFMLAMDNRARGLDSLVLGPRAFGHVGAGGSLGFADPDLGLSFGYAMTKMGPGLLLNPRGQSLADAARACAAAA